jgi:hypothetical protein
MRPIFLISAIVLALTGVAHAQSPTEQFIPIGKTPAENIMQGELVASAQVQSASGPTAFTMTAGGAERTYVIGPLTRVYVDRTKQGETNLLGNLTDLRAGREVEALVPDLNTRVATWVKVRQ